MTKLYIFLLLLLGSSSCKSQSFTATQDISDSEIAYLLSNLYVDNILQSTIDDLSLSFFSISDPNSKKEIITETGETRIKYILTLSKSGEYCDTCSKVYSFSSQYWLPKEGVEIVSKNDKLIFKAVPSNNKINTLVIEIDNF